MNEGFVRDYKILEVASNILYMPFMTKEYAEYVTACCMEKNTWAPFKGDRKYSTYDIHLKKEIPELYEVIGDHLSEQVWPAVCNWWGIEPIEVSDMFALRYTEDTQTKLDLHHDDSFVSASVKLNDDYIGAELKFPKQGFSNAAIPVGGILVWPSNITHPHKCTNLIEGEKYSLTIWTKQC